MNQTITLTLKKETKGALQYANPAAESDALHTIDTIYLRKAGVQAATKKGTSWPQSITLTLEA